MIIPRVESAYMHTLHLEFLLSTRHMHTNCITSLVDWQNLHPVSKLEVSSCTERDTIEKIRTHRYTVTKVTRGLKNSSRGVQVSENLVARNVSLQNGSFTVLPCLK